MITDNSSDARETPVRDAPLAEAHATRRAPQPSDLGRVSGLVDRVLDARDRLFSRPDFQRFAAKFPLTRGVARRHARAAFDLCAGFVYSQVVQACIRLNVFAHLAERPQTLDELAPKLGLGRREAEILLRAAVSIELVSVRRGGRYALGALGRGFVGNPSLTAMVQHNGVFYADLLDPVALLQDPQKATRIKDYWAYVRRDAERMTAGDVADYSALMAATQQMIADDIIDVAGFDRHRALLDIGGGEGAFLAAVARRVPGLTLSLFDLPAVAARAGEQLGRQGLSDRIRVISGSFKTDTLPDGADIVTLVRIVHDHNNDVVIDLFRAIHRALPPGGTLIVAEPLAGTRGAEPMADAYFGFYLLAMGSGRARTAAEISELLVAAGFGEIRHIPTSRPLLVSVLRARRIA
jgi:demethylspheroidene O-methyltransferase